MNGEEVKALIHTLVHLDSSALNWYRLGKSWWETFLILCLVCLGGIVFTFWLVDLVGLTNLLERIQIIRHLQKWYQKVKNRLVRKLVDFALNHGYFTIFLLNVIPAAIFFTTATIIAAKLTKSKWAFWLIISGNVVKVLILVTWTYWIGHWIWYLIKYLFK